VDEVMQYFPSSSETSRSRFLDFMHDETQPPDLWRSLRQQIFLGEEQFIKAALQHIPANTTSEKEIPRIQRQCRPHSIREYLDQFESREAAIRAAFQSGSFTMREIAAELGVHYATVSRAINRAECK
jgi:DNA-binding NarL/FixJ family response regulator